MFYLRLMSPCVFFGAAIVAFTLPLPRAWAEFADMRNIFVDRFDYTFSTSHINSIMQNAADLGFTDVVFQVRGRGDAFYDSNFEPPANGLPAGFDPLQTAIDAAHSHGLKLHAWLNASTMWNTTAINPPAGHMFHNTSPSFRLTDINGNMEPQQGWSNYSSVNPVLPEVHTHINNVVNDIVTNYDVDGINLDYIRYIPGNSFDTLPHDTLSHQMFQLENPGVDPTNPANAGIYRDFVKGRITDLVSSVKTTVDAAEVSLGQAVDLSVDVWRDPDIGENDYLQDYRTWLENDYVDIAMPMIYLSASNDHLFLPNLLNTLSIPTSAKIAPTLGVYLHTEGNGGVELTTTQLQRLYDNGTDGAGFYDYPAVFTGSLAEERQAAIANFYASIEDPGPGTISPDANILVNFELDEGPFNVSPTYSGSTYGVDNATADRTNLESYIGQYSQQISIDGTGAQDWFVRHLSGLADPSNNLELATQGSLGFWLKTVDPGMQVAMVIDDPDTGERGQLKPIIADGDWHLYEWDLEDDNQWIGWVNGDGVVSDATTTIDSVQFFGAGDAVIYMDAVAHNPLGSLFTPLMSADFDEDFDVDDMDLGMWESAFGIDGTGDTDNDNDSDGLDFLGWQQQFGSGGAPLTALTAPLPEPSSTLLLAFGCSLVMSVIRNRLCLPVL